MILEPITIDIDTMKEIYANDYCRDLFKTYPDYYKKVGYHLPWIGYFILRDGAPVGCCGFVSQPINNKVEIAYGTFKAYEGQGVASFGCKQLIAIALQTNPGLIITAKTAPQKNASAAILQRNGFVFTGIVQDHEIGDAWEWVYGKI